MKHDMTKQLADLKAADAETLEKLAETAPADDRALARMLAAAERRADGIPTEDLRLVTARRRVIWPRAAMIAMGVLVCGAAGTGIVHLARIAPVPEEDVLETTAPAVTEEPADLADAVSADMAETDVPAETDAPRTTAVPVTTDAPALVVLEAPATTAAQTTAAAASTRASTKTVAKTAARATETVPAVQTEAPATAAPTPVTATDAPVTTDVPATTMTTAETATAPIEAAEDTEQWPGYAVQQTTSREHGTVVSFRWLGDIAPSPDGPLAAYSLDLDGFQMTPYSRQEIYEILPSRTYVITAKSENAIYTLHVTQSRRTAFTGTQAMDDLLVNSLPILTAHTIGGHPAFSAMCGARCVIFYDDGAYTFQITGDDSFWRPYLTDICAALTRDDSAPVYDAETYAALQAVREAGDRVFGIYERQEAVLKGEFPADAPRLTREAMQQIIAEHPDYADAAQALRETYPYPDLVHGSGVTLIEYWCGETDDEMILLTPEQGDILYINKNAEQTEYLLK